MNIDFQFNHTQLSVVELQKSGIRSAKWLEESFYDPYGKLIDITITIDQFPLFISFGFSDSMLPILFIFGIEGDTIISKQARLLTRDEIKRYYCGN